jgi:hypothetical protein
VVGIDVADQRAAGHDLVVEDHLAVVAPVDARELVVARGEDRRDALRLRQRDERVVAQLARQRMLREPRLARGGPQAVDRAAVARRAGRARKVPQQVGLVLLGIVGQRPTRRSRRQRSPPAATRAWISGYATTASRMSGAPLE